MRRARVDPEKAAAAVEAVREGTMSLRHAAGTFAVSKSSIHKRLKGVVPVQIREGDEWQVARVPPRSTTI